MTAGQVIEIGTVMPDETDAFLALMCEAFEMEFEAAKSVFYADPYFEPDNKYVLRIDGEIVSCLTAAAHTCWIGDAVVRVAGVAGVATRQGFRRRGLAGLLITDTVRALTARGFQIGALFPVIRDYYRCFGWETAGVRHTARQMAAEPAGSRELADVRKATEADIPALAHLYNRAASGRAMHLLRDEKRWRYLLTYLPHSRVVLGTDDAVAGYILVDFQGRGAGGLQLSGDGGTGAVVRVLEMVGETECARRGLRRYLHAERGSGMIEYAESPEILVQNGFVAPDDAKPSFMARILDWQGLLTTLAANWRGVEGELGLALVDPIHAPAPLTTIVRCAGGRVDMEPVDPVDLAAGRRGSIIGDVHGWSTVAVGHYGGRAACETGILKASSTRAADLAETLFPARAPFIPTADHF